MYICTTDHEIADRGGDVVHSAQGRGGQDVVYKCGPSVLYLTGVMAVGTSEGKRKGVTEGAARFSACDVGGQTATGASAR